MSLFRLQIVRQLVSRASLTDEAALGFGDMIKAVVDIERGVMAIGAELHSDEEAALLDDAALRSEIRRAIGVLVSDQ